MSTPFFIVRFYVMLTCVMYDKPYICFNVLKGTEIEWARVDNASHENFAIY